MVSGRYSGFDIMRRTRVFQGVVVVSLLLLTAGLFFFQIAQGDEYVKLASRNRLRILRISAPRGSILDINGAPLAVNVRTFNLSGYPVDLQKDENVKATAALLTRSGIPMDEARLRELVDKQYSAPYRAITVATNLTFAQVAEMIMDRDFKKALFITPVWKRTYPAAQYAAHVVGYVAEITKEELETRDRELYRGGDMIGKNGIEREYEDILRGAAGEEVIEVDSRGRRLRNISYVKTQKGGDMTLTIDLTAQRYAAELMGKFRGALIAIDVHDGSIRCLYSSPSYDPNPLTWGISNKEWAALTDHVERPMMNRAISGAYPPASTFKVITGTAILENKIANRNTKINCPGWFELGNRRFRCWKRSGHGAIGLSGGITYSCDVVFYEIGKGFYYSESDPEGMQETFRRYGLGSATGIDLPGEEVGRVPDAQWKWDHYKSMGYSDEDCTWQGGENANLAIGQGDLLVTSLQMATAYCSIANGGPVWRPHLMRGVRSRIGDGLVSEYRCEQLAHDVALRIATRA